MKLGFIGLGLIGGSIAKAARKKNPEAEIIAFDRNMQSLKLALASGTISHIAAQLDESFSQCDFLFLCTPVHSNAEYLPCLKKYLAQTTVLTDVGSVKGDMHEAIQTAGLSRWFVGGHPMAGSEKSGFANASDHLLENAYYILTPTEDTPDEKTKLLYQFVESLDALPLILTPQQHDYVTGAISHLPHIIAASLVNFVKDSDSADGIMKLIAAGGFKDITRIASSSPDMWEQILIANHTNISALLSKYMDALGQIKSQIDHLNSPAIHQFFVSSSDYRNSFTDTPSGPIKKVYAVYCDIIDESGAIATIATILATNAISIKNIGIVHNREFEDGALRIEFETKDEADKAADLLEKHRYILYKRT
ncbi:prephenate dehydrogenase [bacterium C-53]|nr:prephenate dehydrogenase [Lachnospiraceae bacterium]NBI01817.1 prephenate dehydrogenase [Lachnospiraceae bacterium]RKJ12232.1 prephenate dehydrogenase [bacterium C-53]